MSVIPMAKVSKRRMRKVGLPIFIALVLLAAGFAWYITTDSFQSMVRRRVVAEIERVTSGRVEIESFHTIPFRFLIEVRNITIHGREAADDVPYAHVDQLIAHIKIISLLESEFGFHSILLEHPVFHIIF